MKLALLSLLGVVVVGCAANTESDPTSSSSAAITANACGAVNFIAPATPSSVGLPYCPTVPASTRGQFRSSKLFATASLGGYCKYTWVPVIAGTTPIADDLTHLPPNSDPDCNIVGPLSDASNPELLSPMHDAAFAQAGAAWLPGSPSTVRVSVIDTSPSALKITEGRSKHGYVVERVIRELSCPGDGLSGPCIGQIESRLGLPQTDTMNVDYTNGGYFGSQGELARAIADAVDAWSSRRTGLTVAGTPAEPNRLVINLSVGWDAGRGYETVGTRTSTSTLAVLAALRHASCRGAIVIAAAGNKSGSPETSGAMYPAAWEAMPAPNKDACMSLEGSTSYYELLHDAIFPKTGVYRPLLWAASGVDAHDRPIASTRNGGVARLAAYADEVVARDGSNFTPNLTGSSMSAAVVSGIAATAWGYAPTMTPADLMTLVYNRGVDLTTNAPQDITQKTPGFCLGGQCSTMTVRRVSLANTLNGLFVGNFDQTVPAWSGQAPKVPSDWSVIDPILGQGQSIDPCPNGVCSLPSSSMMTSAAQPWVNPQPGVIGCEVCGLSNLNTLYLIIGGSYVNQTGTLQVNTSSGTQYYQVTPSSTSTSYKLSGVSSTIQSASLSFAKPGGLATQEPLMMLQ